MTLPHPIDRYVIPSGGLLHLGTTVIAPVPEFIGAPLSGSTPLAVTFTNQSTGTYSALHWDFGDGQTSTSAHPTHAYATEGDYTVTLTLIWDGGEVTRTRAAYVHAATPVGALNFGQAANSGLLALGFPNGVN